MNPFTNARIVGENVPYSQYSQQTVQRGDPSFVMSRGELMEFAACPHRWRMGYQSSGSRATEWGSLIDCLALQPHQFDSLFAVTPATYESHGMECPVCKSVTSAKTCAKCKTDRVPVTVLKPWTSNEKSCEEWEIEQEVNGKTVIKSEVFNRAKAAIKTLFDNPRAAELINCSRRQVMIRAEFKSRAGLVIPVRMLLDMVPDKAHADFGRWLVDLKTGASGDEFDFRSSIFEHHYDAQGAMCADGYVAATKEDRTDFVHLVQENKEPWEVAYPFPSMDEEWLALGRHKIVHALEYYAQCLASNNWPSYKPSVQPWGDIYKLKHTPFMETRTMERTFGQIGEPLTLPKIEPITTPLAHITP